MALSVNTNTPAIVAQNNLFKANNNVQSSLERLSTGLKINRASDNASGLVISEHQRATIAGLQTAIANIDRATAFSSTAEAALSRVNELLINLRNLAVDSANTGALDSTALNANQAEVTELLRTINNIDVATKLGAKTVFGTAALTFQVGAFETDIASFSVGRTDSTTLNIQAINVSTGASAAIVSIDAAISQVSGLRGSLGAFQKNTLLATQSNLRTQVEQLTAAESLVRDTDFATEIANFSNYQVRQSGASQVLGIANQNAQSILQLLQGLR